MSIFGENARKGKSQKELIEILITPVIIGIRNGRASGLQYIRTIR